MSGQMYCWIGSDGGWKLGEVVCWRSDHVAVVRDVYSGRYETLLNPQPYQGVKSQGPSK